jgi:hypothetical protein
MIKKKPMIPASFTSLDKTLKIVLLLSIHRIFNVRIRFSNMNNYRIASRAGAKKEKIINYREELEKLEKANALLKERLESAKIKNVELTEMNAWLKKTKHVYKEKFENENEGSLELNRKLLELKRELELLKKDRK